MRIHSTFISQGCQSSLVSQGSQVGELGQTDHDCPIGEGGACSLVGPGRGGGGGLGGQVVNMVQVVQVVREVRVIQVVQLVKGVSLDDMHSENIWCTWSKPSDY